MSDKYRCHVKEIGEGGVALYLNLGSHLSEEVAWLE